MLELSFENATVGKNRLRTALDPPATSRQYDTEGFKKKALIIEEGGGGKGDLSDDQ